jgi:hypothetical protein
VIAGQRRRLADFGDARIMRDLQNLISYSGGPFTSGAAAAGGISSDRQA